MIRKGGAGESHSEGSSGPEGGKRTPQGLGAGQALPSQVDGGQEHVCSQQLPKPCVTNFLPLYCIVDFFKCSIGKGLLEGCEV